MSREVVIARHGGPDVLEMRERTLGRPGPGQIKLRHSAIGLNFVDTYQRSGLYKQPLPFVGGNEGSGVVLEVGEGVSGLAPGDRIAYSSVLGAYAEERMLPADRAVPLPPGIDDQTAAAMMLKGTTAYYLLHQTFRVEPGHTILVHAAAGGVGQIACQWAKALGARVIGTVGSDEKAAIAARCGCDLVINYTSQNFVVQVREFTHQHGVDVVYDGVGRDTFEASLDCLKPRGLMVSFGNASGPVAIPDLGILARKGSLYVTRPTTAAYFSTAQAYQDAAKSLVEAVAGGKIRVSVDRTFPLSDVASAHRALEARATTGSVVLLP